MEQTIKAHDVLLANGAILNLQTGRNEQVDLVVMNGNIDAIRKIDAASFSGKVIDLGGPVIVPGLIDMHVHLREPGREDEETVESGARAAMAGGFTAVCSMPNTDPACDKQEIVRFLKKQAEALPVEVFPIAAITKKREGKEITEMAELLRAGAVAFSDDGSPVQNAAVMRRALEYASMYGAPIIDHCEDQHLSAGGHMHEGRMSTRLGVAGVPDISEEIMISRDISLAAYTGGHIHIAHISTQKGVEQVRRAKEAGIKVTCEVTPHHLALTDEALLHYDTNLKMSPPLRTAVDVEALMAALKDGTIDVFASDHAPHSVEEKEVEFAAAPNGILGLQSMVGIILAHVVKPGHLTLAEALAKMTINPRKILNIAVPEIKVGAPANLTFLHPDKTWVFDPALNRSLSRNTPFWGWSLQGQVGGVCNKGLIWLA